MSKSEFGIAVPQDLQATFEQFAPFYSVDFIKSQVDDPRAQANYLYKVKEPIGQLLGAYHAAILVATPINQKKGIVFPPDLIRDMQQVNYMKLGKIREGKVDPILLVDYLDRYASIHERLNEIVDLSQPIVGKISDIDPDTNLPITRTENINFPPNHPYDPAQTVTYLRDYQTTVLRKCIEQYSGHLLRRKMVEGNKKSNSSLKVQVETKYEMNCSMDIVQNLLTKVGNLANRNASS